MKKYTFIAEYKGGTYISQYKGTNMVETLSIWANNLPSEYFTDRIKNRIKDRVEEQVKDKDFYPVPVKTIENVWCTGYVIFRSFLLVNIVETV